MTATISRTIELIFGATDNTESIFYNLNDNMQTFDDGVQAIAEPFANFTHDLLAAEAGVVALGTALVSFSINEAGTFKTGVSELGALFNATTDQTGQLSDSILDFSRDAKFSIEDINSATFTAISTGTEWAEVTGLLTDAQILAVGGSSSLSSATELLSRSLNIYGEEAGTATEASESLFVAAQQGDTNFTELSASLGKLLQPAKSASVGFNEMLAAVAAVTIGTGNTAESMTLLKSLFKELASPSTELTTALGGMTLESNSLWEIMQQLQVATGGQFAAMDALFGSTEAVNGALILSTDTSGKFRDALQAMEEKTGKLGASYNRMKDDFAGINQNLVNNVRATFIQVGIPLLNEYGDAVGALSGIFKTVGIEIEEGALKPLAVLLEQFAKQASESLTGVGDALPEALDQLDFNELIKSFKEISDELGDIFDAIFGGDLDLSKPEDLAKALQTALNITSSLVGITKEILNEFRPVFEAIGEAGRQLEGTSNDSEAAIGKFLATMTLLSDFGTALGTLLVVIRETDADVHNVFNTLAGSSRFLVNIVQASFDLVVGIVVDTLAGIATAFELITPDILGDPWGGIAADLSALSDAVGQNFYRNVSEAGDGLTQLGQGLSLLGERANESVGNLENVDVGLGTLQAETGKTEAEIDSLLNTFYGTDEQLNVFLASLYGSGNAMHQLTTETSTSGFELVKYKGASDQATNATEKNANAVDSLSDSQRLSIENTHEMELSLLSLASNERIASMEFSASVNIANIQADASTVIAAYESIASVIESTSEAQVGLWGLFADQGGWTGSNELEQAALREEIRKDKALRQQEKLINAQVDLMRARIAAIQKGDSKVTIDVQNAEPEMKLLLKSLFEFIMVTANEEGMELLTL